MTDDHEMQKDFEQSGSIYPKVEASHIDDLMNLVSCSAHAIEGTTTTVATAMIDLAGIKFTLAHESTACVDPKNFNAEKGARYAIEKAMESARNKLWELEGYLFARSRGWVQFTGANWPAMVQFTGGQLDNETFDFVLQNGDRLERGDIAAYDEQSNNYIKKDVTK
ncbi:MAG: Gp49 family protein [Shewanella sp.]